MTLYTTAPKQCLHVPSAPCAFTLSFHSSPQSVLHSVLVCHLGRRQSMPWLGPTFLHAGWSANCTFHLLSHLFPMRTDNGQIFPAFPSSWASLIHLQNVCTSVSNLIGNHHKLDWQMGNVIMWQVGKNTVQPSIKESWEVIWQQAISLLPDIHHLTVSYGTNSDSRCWSPRELLIWGTFELQDCSFKQTNWIKFFTK